MDRPTCKTCVYYDPIGSSAEQGFCRFGPPSDSFFDKKGTMFTYAVWRVVENDDWCGAHHNFPRFVAGTRDMNDLMMIRENEQNGLIPKSVADFMRQNIYTGRPKP